MAVVIIVLSSLILLFYPKHYEAIRRLLLKQPRSINGLTWHWPFKSTTFNPDKFVMSMSKTTKLISAFQSTDYDADNVITLMVKILY